MTHMTSTSFSFKIYDKETGELLFNQRHRTTITDSLRSSLRLFVSVHLMNFVVNHPNKHIQCHIDIDETEFSESIIF